LALVLAAASVVVADESVHELARNTPSKRTLRAVTSAPAHIDVLGIGNSLMAAGFDSAELQRAFLQSGTPRSVVNGAVGATGVVEHLAMTRLALKDHTVGTLVYGFYDQQMSSEFLESNSDLIGNRNLLYYLEPEVALEYARFDRINRWAFQVSRSSALLRERSAIWEKVEKLRRSLAGMGLPAGENNHFGRTADFALLEAADSQRFSRACADVIQSGAYLTKPVEALFRQAAAHGVQVVVVEMPMHPNHRREFYSQPIWAEFRSKTRRAVEVLGARYLNASDWVPEAESFADPVHLGEKGGKVFSRKLAEYLTQPGQVPPR
jgi:hypothetical protein